MTQDNKRHNNSKYAETFDRMLCILLFIAFRDQPTTCCDVQESVYNEHVATLRRHLNALTELGYLERITKPGNSKARFIATEKTKQLFGK